MKIFRGYQLIYWLQMCIFLVVGGGDAAGADGVGPGPKDGAGFAKGGAEFSAGGRAAQVLRGDGAFGRVGQGAERRARRLARLLAANQPKVRASQISPIFVLKRFGRRRINELYVRESEQVLPYALAQGDLEGLVTFYANRGRRNQFIHPTHPN